MKNDLDLEMNWYFTVSLEGVDQDIFNLPLPYPRQDDQGGKHCKGPLSLVSPQFVFCCHRVFGPPNPVGGVMNMNKTTCDAI